MTPKFEHDCDKCEFLASISLDMSAGDEKNEFDLYHCPAGAAPGGSLIARGGDEGWDYYSGIPMPASQTPRLAIPGAMALRVAQFLAIEMQLLAEETKFVSLWEPVPEELNDVECAEGMFPDESGD